VDRGLGPAVLIRGTPPSATAGFPAVALVWSNYQRTVLTTDRAAPSPAVLTACTVKR
jgi:hypothetical protein